MADKKETIEIACKRYAECNDAVTELTAEIRSEVETIKTKFYKPVKNAVDKLQTAHKVLSDLIAEAPELFEKPKTVIFHGVKVGFVKSKDTIEIADAAKTVKAIEEEFDADTQELFIITEKKPSKTEILAANLDKDSLKAIKCKLVIGKDEVIVKTVDDEVNKFIKALTKQAEEVE